MPMIATSFTSAPDRLECEGEDLDAVGVDVEGHDPQLDLHAEVEPGWITLGQAGFDPHHVIELHEPDPVGLEVLAGRVSGERNHRWEALGRPRHEGPAPGKQDLCHHAGAPRAVRLHRERRRAAALAPAAYQLGLVGRPGEDVSEWLLHSCAPVLVSRQHARRNCNDAEEIARPSSPSSRTRTRAATRSWSPVVTSVEVRNGPVLPRARNITCEDRASNRSLPTTCAAASSAAVSRITSCGPRWRAASGDAGSSASSPGPQRPASARRPAEACQGGGSAGEAVTSMDRVSIFPSRRGGWPMAAP